MHSSFITSSSSWVKNKCWCCCRCFCSYIFIKFEEDWRNVENRTEPAAEQRPSPSLVKWRRKRLMLWKRGAGRSKLEFPHCFATTTTQRVRASVYHRRRCCSCFNFPKMTRLLLVTVSYSGGVREARIKCRRWLDDAHHHRHHRFNYVLVFE